MMRTFTTIHRGKKRLCGKHVSLLVTDFEKFYTAFARSQGIPPRGYSGGSLSNPGPPGVCPHLQPGALPLSYGGTSPA